MGPGSAKWQGLWRHDLERVLLPTGACRPDGWTSELPGHSKAVETHLLVAGHDEGY